ncbi:type II toxin-antitoxin system death-on-curing family toxin [Neobacillus drentensis]|uniref:type II toxin-antitoxin system death-on-curing family toxin n=1 Tax=Neobacillus drentensis TaxID=220684 RepID=UPI0030022EAF
MNEEYYYEEEIQYFTAEELELIHFAIMELTDDSEQAGIKYPDRFDSCLKRPQTDYFGEPQYPTLLEKAGAYFHSVCKDHIFHNGNKRTALAVLTTFLQINGYELTMTPEEAEEYTVLVADDDSYKGNGVARRIAADLADFVAPIEEEEY